MDILHLNAVDTTRVKGRIDRLLDGENIVLVKPNWPRQQIPWDQIAFYDDPESELAYYVGEFNMHSEAAAIGFDNLPFFRVDFGRVAYLMSIAYGCSVEKINQLINSRPRINRAEDLSILEKPAHIEECGLYPIISERMQAIERRFGPVPFVPSDVQSPIDVLTTIVTSDVCMVAMFDQPEVLHCLLSDITASITEIVQYQKSLVTNWLGSGHDYPITRGIHLSDDAAAYLSPRTYQKFALPYNEQLAQDFDGITLHCCMRYQQNLALMSGTRGFLGFDPQPAYNDIDAILQSIRGKGFWRIHHLPENTEPELYYKDIIDRSDGVCGLMLEVFGGTREIALSLADVLVNYALQKGRA
jgi:hypothetical protein